MRFAGDGEAVRDASGAAAMTFAILATVISLAIAVAVVASLVALVAWSDRRRAAGSIRRLGRRPRRIRRHGMRRCIR